MVPEPKPALVQAPASAGVGLRFRPRTADPCWPEDWWQRNYDTCEPETLLPCWTERHLRIPVPPVEVP